MTTEYVGGGDSVTKVLLCVSLCAVLVLLHVFVACVTFSNR